MKAFALCSLLFFGTICCAASTERVLPRRCVRAEFTREKNISLSDIRLTHKNTSFILIIKEIRIPIRECFVAKLIRNVDWDVITRYTDAGDKLLVKRLAPGEFEIRLAGGLDGGLNIPVVMTSEMSVYIYVNIWVVVHVIRSMVYGRREVRATPHEDLDAVSFYEQSLQRRDGLEYEESQNHLVSGGTQRAKISPMALLNKLLMDLSTLLLKYSL